MIVWSRYATPFGDGAVVCRGDRIAAILLPPARREKLETLVAAQAPEAREENSPGAFLRRVASDLSAYFRKGAAPGNLLPLIEWPRVPAFTKSILEHCAAIPRGGVLGYGELAGAAGFDRSRYGRAVGQVMARNPLPLVIPCHRVLTSDHRLGDYGGGLEMKRWLLECEGASPLVRG